ncbi:hypothetical protein [Mycobacterium angelicum]|uniref:Uncharacterized protein n=1 Tax=Mycobacterium angelicum TaxID=470074 RepID=A0A1W9ZZL2_MYCAN|nr:hypothetical protein [Mycobacterium angelicum]MCV7196256.1 hypothetical protein [Mycobacterium angelicum]ORA23239.1 hypothetical protein BST12_07080 [Mycobacterium angelicum]
MTLGFDMRSGRTTPLMRPPTGHSTAAAPPAPRPPSAVPPPSRPAPLTDLTKVSIYLDEPTDTFLETVRTAARFAKPRVDATRSAVVRLALNRLAEQLHPTDLIAELQRNAANHTGPGRKRG